jgi:hypothetical protein
MAWVDLCSADYTGAYADNEKLHVTIQYNNSSITITTLTLRCIGDPAWNGDDTYFVCDRAGTFQRLTYMRNSGSGAYTSNTFTVTKGAYDKSFSIPELWICHDGQHWPAATYTDDNWRGHYVYFTSGRTNFKSVINSEGTSLPTSVYVTDVGTGTTTITDNLNNSFTITAAKGGNGTNNAAKGLINLKWGYTTARSSTYTNKQTIQLTRDNPDSETRTVYAESTTDATYGDDKKSTTDKAIKQYYDPGDPGAPALTNSSFKNNRLTLKQNWQYLWTPATKRGASDVAGYRVRVKKNGAFIKGLIYNSNGKSLTLGTGTNEYVDTEDKNNSITFNPVNLGFSVGDTVQLRIHAYSKNGLGQSRWGDGAHQSLFSAMKESEERPVQTAGVLNVKTSSDWKEGQVWIKTPSGWKEADTVYVKTADGWKESQ